MPKTKKFKELRDKLADKPYPKVTVSDKLTVSEKGWPVPLLKGTKHDQDKAPLAYNYTRFEIETAICNTMEDEEFLTDYITNSNLILDECLKSDNNPDVISDTLGVLIETVTQHYNLDPLEKIELVSRVCKYGADKYGLNNYLKGIEPYRLLSAAKRHLYQILLQNEKNDKESSLPHIGHVLANLAMLLESC